MASGGIDFKACDTEGAKGCATNTDTDKGTVKNADSVSADVEASSNPTKYPQNSETIPCKYSVEDLEKRFRYMKFQHYDFTKDDQFQRGWKKLEEVVSSEQIDEQLLKAKLFYYSKHFESIDVDDYLTWKEKPSNEYIPGEQFDKKGDNSDRSSATVPERGSDEVNLTFSEVMELIQSGRNIPGIQKSDVQLSHTDPSPSVLERKTKPWER